MVPNKDCITELSSPLRLIVKKAIINLGQPYESHKPSKGVSCLPNWWLIQFGAINWSSLRISCWMKIARACMLPRALSMVSKTFSRIIPWWAFDVCLSQATGSGHLILELHLNKASLRGMPVFSSTSTLKSLRPGEDEALELHVSWSLLCSLPFWESPSS